MSHRESDSLGTRMKGYEIAARSGLPGRTPVIVRVDGKAFHAYTRDCKRPFDERLSGVMVATARELCNQIQGCQLAYTQSDEISLLLHGFKKFDSQPRFDNQVQKIASVAAGLASSTFTARRGGTPPAWFSKDVVANLKKLETEYVRLFEPYERAKHEKALADRRAQLELDLATGKMSLPVGIASQVKSVDDLKKFGLYDNWLGEREFELRCASWDYILTYRVIGSYGYVGERVFSRTPDGMCCRTFRAAPPDKGNNWEKDAPDISHMWVKVFTCKDDFDIIKVESGIDVR